MVVFVHSEALGERRAVGRSIIVGMMIFSIVIGLGCGGGLSRVFVLMRLVLLVQFLLRMQRMLILRLAPG